MRIPRFTIPHSENLKTGLTLELTGESLHHLQNVLHLKPGEDVIVIGEDEPRAFLCSIKVVEKKSAALLIKEALKTNRTIPISLIIGLIKQNCCDTIVQQAVELGVTNIYFFTADRSSYSLTEEQERKRTERMKRVAIAAMKQSGASTWPNITFFKSLEEALAASKGQSPDTAFCKIVFTCPSINKESEDQVPKIATLLNSLKEKNQKKEFFLLLGPEGGLSEEEIETAGNHDYLRASLGTKILRTETAAIVTAGIISAFSEGV